MTSRPWLRVGEPPFRKTGTRRAQKPDPAGCCHGNIASVPLEREKQHSSEHIRPGSRVNRGGGPEKAAVTKTPEKRCLVLPSAARGARAWKRATCIPDRLPGEPRRRGSAASSSTLAASAGRLGMARDQERVGTQRDADAGPWPRRSDTTFWCTPPATVPVEGGIVRARRGRDPSLRHDLTRPRAGYIACRVTLQAQGGGAAVHPSPLRERRLGPYSRSGPARSRPPRLRAAGRQASTFFHRGPREVQVSATLGSSCRTPAALRAASGRRGGNHRMEGADPWKLSM
jgi:hypothetical protein